MAETFGNSPSSFSSPPTGAGTEYERSIGRSVEPEDKTPSDLRSKINEDIGAVKQAAEDAAHTAADRATDMAERQKSFAADQIGKIATALEKVGGELQAQQAGAVGDYTRQLGSSARQFADRMKSKDIGQIASYAENFGRRQPLAFLGLAAVAGLAASRFLMASADRSGSSPATASNVSGSNVSSTIPKETYNG